MNKQKKETLEELIQQPADEATEEVEIKEEIEGTRGKRRKKKMIILIFLLVVLLIGGGYAGWLIIQADKNLTEEEKTTEEVNLEETTPEEPVSAEKSYYVNADVGLNLRQEPSTTAPILIIIPNGTKLTILETKDSWYKTEYQGKTGWVAAEFVTEKNPLFYENSTYGFSLTFPGAWSGYKIFQKTDTDGSITLYVGIPTTDTAWQESDPVEDGFASLFAISVFSSAYWDTIKDSDGPKPTYLGESKGYIIAWSSGQATPTDLTQRFAEIKSIIETFKVIK